jgi:hypothetical protein
VLGWGVRILVGMDVERRLRACHPLGGFGFSSGVGFILAEEEGVLQGLDLGCVGVIWTDRGLKTGIVFVLSSGAVRMLRRVGGMWSASFSLPKVFLQRS